MNDKTADSNKRRLAVAAISAVALIILVQFVDSYCTEMFGKTQSLSVRTFLMDPRGMSSEAAVAYMSRGMLPFYLIGALTPFIRSYTDIIGRKKMMIINVALLAVGSAVCLLANNLWIYLLGNGILILGYSLDIHLIYIVDGKMQTQPGLIVKVNGKKLALNKDYSVRYLNNKNIGHASITVTGKGNYSGSLTKKFDIVLPVGKTISVGNLKYRVTNASINGKGQVSVIGSTYKKNSRKLKTVNIGSSIVVGNMKYNITSIEKNAFKGCKYLSGVNIGPGVKVIGASAFEKCVRLNKVTIKTMYLKFVGKKAFSSIYKKAVFKLPRKKYSVYVRMIKKTRVSTKVIFKRV